MFLARDLNLHNQLITNYIFMIAKKNSRYDLEGKRIVLFNIGLLTAGAFTLAAFTYSEPIALEKEKGEVASINVDYVIELEAKPELKPEPVRQPQVTPPQGNPSVGDPNALSQNIRTITGASTPTSSAVVVGAPSGIDRPNFNPGPIDLGEVEKWPKVDAQFIGGTVKMTENIIDRLVYPQIDKEMGNQGKVYVSFVVEKDGSITGVEIERGVSPTIDREAKRIVSSFPKWKPGENDKGAIVRTRVMLPIVFTLE